MEEKKEKKPGFWNKLRESKMRQVIFFVVNMVVLFAIYIPSVKYIPMSKKANDLKEQRISSDNNLLTGIEEVTKTDSKIYVSGWAVRLGAENKGIYLMLKSIDGSDEKVIFTDTYSRNDISNYYDSKSVFGEIGFKASINEKELKENISYEIFVTLEYRNEVVVDEEKTFVESSKKVSTGMYLYNGELYPYEFESFVEPSIENVEIQKIVREGTLLAYDIEKRCWIYVENGYLYWIVDEMSLGSIDKSPEIPMFLYTSQNNKLPEDKVELGRDYIGYYFSTDDIKYGNYYICSMPIPQGYPITYIETGVYQNKGENKGWVWKTIIKNNFCIQ